MLKQPSRYRRKTTKLTHIVFVVTGELLEMDRTDDEWFADEPW